MAKISDLGIPAAGTGVLLPYKRYNETDKEYQDRCQKYINKCRRKVLDRAYHNAMTIVTEQQE